MIHRFAPILLAGMAALMLFLIGRVPPIWQAAMVVCLCVTASLTIGWMIHRTRPSRLPGPLLLVLAAFSCLVWVLVVAHTLQALFAPQPGTPERVIARKVTAVSAFVFVTTVVFMILRGEFKAYLARRRTGR